MLALLLPLVTLVFSQDPEPEPEKVDDRPPIVRFRSLEEASRSSLVRGLVRRISLDPDPVIQRIVSLEKTFGTLPEAKPRSFHDPERWAKGVAPKRIMVAKGSPAHEAVRRSLPRVGFLPDLNRAVWYDWGRGEIVRRLQPLTDEEVYQNCLAGYPPGSDQALAQILAILDKESPHRRVAAYCDHLYADLDAHVYEGITLYEAWYSGEVVDVPDVDAVPFAVEILKTKRFVSPIPGGPDRTWLYQQISQAASAYRKWRTLREAAAAVYVHADPELDGPYRNLIPRLHYLYAVHEEDPLEVANHLKSLKDRDDFVQWADRNVKESREAYELRETRRNTMLGLAASLRKSAVLALDR